MVTAGAPTVDQQANAPLPHGGVQVRIDQSDIQRGLGTSELLFCAIDG